MTNGVTVDSLAKSYADRVLGYQNIAEPRRTLVRKHAEYSFKTTGCNALTVASIVLLAVAIFTSSFLALAVWAIVSGVRRAFRREIWETALLGPDAGPVNPELLQRIANMNPVQRRNEIADHLEIEDENWQPVQYQLFDFEVWFSGPPALPPLEQQPAAAGAAAAQPAQ